MLPLEWICTKFENDQVITDTDLRTALDESEAQQALLTLNFMVGQEMVTRVVLRGQTTFSVKDKNAIRRLVTDTKTPSVASLTKRVLQPNVLPPIDNQSTADALVVSAPLSMIGKLRSLQARYSSLPIRDLKETFADLLARAQKEVLLSVPFLELDGLMVFVDKIRDLGGRKVAVKALTRELVAPVRYDYGYYQKLRAFSKLVDLYTTGGGNPDLVEVRDFTIKIGSASASDIVYEGIHQKMIIADRTWAYVGSGEIRAPSFIVNGEVGVLQQGPVAEFWADYFLLFWSEARKIEHQFFRSAQFPNSRDMT